MDIINPNGNMGDIGNVSRGGGMSTATLIVGIIFGVGILVLLILNLLQRQKFLKTVEELKRLQYNYPRELSRSQAARVIVINMQKSGVSNAEIKNKLMTEYQLDAIVIDALLMEMPPKPAES